MAKSYELTFIVSGSVSTEEGENILNETKKYIQDLDGAITNEKKWGARRLAYPIKKIDQGYYFSLNFDFEGTNLAKLDRFLLMHKGIIRFLVSESYKKTGTMHFKDSRLGKETTKKVVKKAEDHPVDEKDRQKKLDEALEKILEN